MCSEDAENALRLQAEMMRHTLDRTGSLLPRIAALEAENARLRAVIENLAVNAERWVTREARRALEDGEA